MLPQPQYITEVFIQLKKRRQSHREEQSKKHDYLMCNWYTDAEKYEVMGKYSKSEKHNEY